MTSTVSNIHTQAATAKLISSARSHAPAAPSAARLERIGERTKRDSIWRTK